MRFNRELMHWFDDFFQLQRTTISLGDFCFEIESVNRPNEYKKLKLSKRTSNRWILEFLLPDEYILKLQNNIHPFFNEYIHDNISIFADNDLYAYLNANLVETFYAIAEFSYDENTHKQYIDFSDFFLGNCFNIAIGEERQISSDKFLKVVDTDKVAIRSRDNRFKLRLSYSETMGENMLDSLIDLRKSVMIMEV